MYTFDLKENTQVAFSSEEQTKEVSVSTNIPEWKVSVPSSASSWLSAKGLRNRLSITVKNNLGEERSAQLTLSGMGVSATIDVKQAAKGPFIEVSASTLLIEKGGGRTTLGVYTNSEYEIVIPSDISWIKASKSIATVEPKELYIDVEWNKGEERKAELKLRTVGTTPIAETKIAITQKSDKGYDGNTSGTISEDIKVPVSSGYASSVQKDTPIENSFDNNYTTIYHSSWANGGANYFPITLEYNFKDQARIDYLIYHPRKDGHNGHFKEVEIWAKYDGSNEYRKVLPYDFKGSPNPTKVAFEKPLINPTAVKFVILSGHGDGKGFASCSEMEFYRINPDKFDPTTIFTDITCSELKPEVTEEQIMEIDNDLYRQIAYYLYKGTYPKEFRIDTFRAWPHPSTQARKNRTNTYSLLDNPTGIAVTKGEDLIVFVGKTHGQNLSLRLLNLDKPNSDGYYDNYVYTLQEGANKIKMDAKGLLYVFYHTENYADAPKIKIHFATGKVQGYYDVQKHAPERYQELLNKANNNQFFDIVGNKAHLTFPVDSYRSFTRGQGKKLIDLYDKLVLDEQIFMGLQKYDRVYGNRAYFHVMYHSYMYSTAYRTAYNATTLEAILDPDRLVKSIWGPAHELGHTHQTGRGFKWKGTTEVTTNVHSLFIQTSWGQPSRVQYEDLKGEGFINRYDKSYSYSFVQRLPYITVPDVFCQLIPFWQLQLYFANVLGNEDFYKDFYEYTRTDPDPADNGRAQVEFSLRASRAAGYDLREFCERWGFYQTGSWEVNDYGKEMLVITDELVSEIKQKIEKLGLKKVTDRIEYISDSNWKVYKDRKSIVRGDKCEVVQEDRLKLFKMHSGWENFVAVEIYNTDNKLICVGNSSKFVLPNTFNKNCKAYAISFDGKKEEIQYR
ncbi:MAG: M60 family metallopeptidase [Porphyromonas sp.]|nr:M60 family metallopeptidase [Porphyromonas sp.]